MSEVIGLVIPFFGLIFIGFVVARTARLPIEALGWMTVFVIYVALPALFFQLLARTPIERLTEWRYIFGAVFSTYIVFATMFIASIVLEGSGIRDSTIKGLAAAYGNIGYMGPGLALLAFGPEAAVPVALIFCFENIMHFTVTPMLMALAAGEGREEKVQPLRLAASVVRQIALHPFMIATAAGVLAAALSLHVPGPIDKLLDYLSNAAAPCALFAMGVTLALRPLKRVPVELGPIALLKLAVHPTVCYLMLSWVGNFSETWVYAAVLLAALPTATNVFVIAQQYNVWVQRASASIVLTTVLSVGSVTTLLFLIKSGTLPPDLFP
ncbi:MAG: AEC family transporter [Rhizobiales bacterium]|nr:AEC family transporter [Hyphomicrobiales bacterium]